MIYSPGMFRWLECLLKDDAQPEELKQEFIEAMGIPAEFREDIRQGNYIATTSGETLVLTIEE
jgi:hypothetical protein